MFEGMIGIIVCIFMYNFPNAGINRGMGSANERWHYDVTSSLICLVQT